MTEYKRKAIAMTEKEKRKVLELAESVKGLAKHALDGDNSKKNLLALSLLSAYLSDSLTVLLAD